MVVCLSQGCQYAEDVQELKRRLDRDKEFLQKELEPMIREAEQFQTRLELDRERLEHDKLVSRHGQNPQQKVRIDKVLDQEAPADEEAIVLDEKDLVAVKFRECLKVFCKSVLLPSILEPSLPQISGLYKIMVANRVPFTDLAVVSQFGDRFQRRAKFPSAGGLDSDGKVVKVEFFWPNCLKE